MTQTGHVPAVSVVIPTARGGRYLREAVASVRLQSFADWELIVVADGCADDLADICGGDERIRFICQSRRGVSVARNVGVRSSRARLVAFLDDDDRMLSERLRLQLAVMQDEKIGLCHTAWRVIDESGTPISAPLGSESRSGEYPQYRDLLEGANVPPITSAMVRKSLFEEVGGFDSTLRMTQDFDLIFRLARESELRGIPEVLTEYRRHRDNARAVLGSSGGVLSNILMRHLRWAEDAGNEADVAAARRGLVKARRSQATRLTVRAYQAAAVREYVPAVKMVLQAARLSPGRSVAAFLRCLGVNTAAVSDTWARVGRWK